MARFWGWLKSRSNNRKSWRAGGKKVGMEGVICSPEVAVKIVISQVNGRDLIQIYRKSLREDKNSPYPTFSGEDLLVGFDDKRIISRGELSKELMGDFLKPFLPLEKKNV